MQNYDKNTDTHYYTGTSASDTEMRQKCIDPSSPWAETNLNMDRHSERLRYDSQYRGYVSSPRSEGLFEFYLGHILRFIESGRFFFGDKIIIEDSKLKTAFNIVVLIILGSFALIFSIPKIIVWLILNIGKILFTLFMIYILFGLLVNLIKSYL